MKTTLPVILNCVCEYYDTTPETIFTRSRKRHIVIPRQMFQYLGTKYTGLPLFAIGNFGGKYGKVSDHATVIHSRKTIINFLDIGDPQVVKDVEAIRSMIMSIEYLTEELIPTSIDLMSMCAA